MDLTTSIAATSINMNQAKLQQNIGIALIDKVMDMETQTAEQLVSQMKAITPPSSQILDTHA